MGARDELIRTADRYRTQVAAIRNDDTLSPKGKRQQLEQLYNDTAPRAAELRRQMDRGQYQSRTALERQLFGLPAGASSSDAISYRDALDRVAAIKDPHQLGELMERAHTSGDDMLLRAGFAHAYQQTRNPLASDLWGGLVAEYVENNPAAGQALAELDGHSVSRAQALTDAVNMSISKPPELNDANLGDVVPDAA
ncbi:hypothetical protein GCM10010169_23400 [Micromonospora fulviviridis]|uniref:hypothetical protein n=1 Tax=Micromonospora fulviviridis TaxID=47860 RepID=UPI00166ACC04|nr:hypothetical protein [Micromonospora fulviviridis]GGR78544.1 hypothetical protein GCM10010169_23400 [Micromonospora fulviviridis]